MCSRIIRRELKVKAAIDTDVNAAAFGEFRWGASQELILQFISPSAPKSAADTSRMASR